MFLYYIHLFLYVALPSVTTVLPAYGTEVGHPAGPTDDPNIPPINEQI
jgi:hypothetical protein